MDIWFKALDSIGHRVDDPVFRYITALTDSEEEEPSDEEPVDEEQPADELCVLLESIDGLRQGPESDKRRSLELLLRRREEFGQQSAFLWRLTRAYCDLHDISSTLEEKKTHAETGNLLKAIVL
ncbi:Regulator of microtubule dynamics protein 2 [Liparis tanakae]|uniref:Regulator of microtubule dynamics protein 2 n=1 Tax=Liparis tanakae TaxID=230148 RepID=A0A4Z2EZI2_9TELE|nr:Regulator of microtubule dynamics protein 2 [Liparis tanakae]